MKTENKSQCDGFILIQGLRIMRVVLKIVMLLVLAAGTVMASGGPQIVAGGFHTVALKSDGTVWTWGDNFHGQLGDGTTLQGLTPAQVSGLAGVVAIAAGDSHTVALKNDGTVWTWGWNGNGQLGDGTYTDSYVPIRVPALSGVTGISSRGFNTVALMSDTTVRTWGANGYGQLGDGTTTNRNTPVQVTGLTGVTFITAGDSHTVALMNDGTVRAWGSNNLGQLGDGTTTNKLYFTATGVSGVTAITSGGSHTVALKSDGTVWAWGLNNKGQLGDGTTTNRNAPVPVSGLGGVAGIASGGFHTVALMSDGTLRAWGGNSSGQLGDGTTTNHNAPAPVSGLSGVAGIAAGGAHTLALMDDGTVRSWGENSDGQLGDGTIEKRRAPVSIIGLGEVTALAAGSSHSVVLKSNGTVQAWGNNAYGQIGDGTTTNRTTSTQVTGLTGVTAIASGYYHTVALISNGTIRAWGWNIYGQLGDTTTDNRSAPVTVKVWVPFSFPTRYVSLSGVTAIVAGEYHTVALKNDGSVWAWGSNAYGQIGDGTTTNRTTATQVSGLTGVIAIAAGNSHTVALKSDGTVWAWGYNLNGQLGDGTTNNHPIPVQVTNLNGVTAIAAGWVHTVALKSNGTAWAWGNNAYGQLGDGTTFYRLTPVQVANLSWVTAIAAGLLHTLALEIDSTVRAWGDNRYGQLGDGTTTERHLPVAVKINDEGTLSGVTAIAAGLYHTAALKRDGTLNAWGFNSSCQLGDATTTQRLFPVQVMGFSATERAMEIAISAGAAHTVALKSDGTAWAWGYNGSGQLGDGTMMKRLTPVQVIGLSNYKAISAGPSHSVGLRFNGYVRAWGDNSYGQLGDGTTTSSLIPVQATGLNGVVTAIAAGSLHTTALKYDGTVWAWGSNSYGQLGLGTLDSTSHPTPAQVTGLTGVIAVAAGLHHTVALMNDGTVRTWGDNVDGQLGDGTSSRRLTPVQVTGLSGVTAIAAGLYHTVALKSDGTVLTWGANYEGQLGDGTYTDSHVPIKVTGLIGVTAISAGSLHTVALMSDGTVRAFGYNDGGQLGDGTNMHRNAPTLVTGLNGVTAIAAGLHHTVALKSDGTVLTWGANSDGQLGDGTTTASTTPLQAKTNALTLTTIITGSGSGSVHSSPVGLSCSSGTCTALFFPNKPVTLLSTPASDSLFGGWMGGCADIGDCTLTMSGVMTVYAQFSRLSDIYPVRLLGGYFYTTLSAAYSAAQNGDTIQAMGASFTKNLVLGRDIDIKLKGGYDSVFDHNPDFSTLKGTLTVRQGKVTIEKFIIQASSSADITPPTNPANLARTAVSSNQIILSWNASDDNVGVTGYRLERCQGASCSGFTQIATPVATAFNDAGLTASTSYSYRVRAVDAAGNLSGYSNTYSASTLSEPDTTPPTNPANLTGTAVSSSQINLSWTASTDNVGVTGYRLEQCQGASCSGFTQIATSAATAFNDAGLTASTSYSYRVRAVDAAGNFSDYSNTYSITTLSTGVSTTFPGGTIGELRALSPTLTFGDLTISGPLTIPSSETSVVLTVANLMVDGYISVTHPTCRTFFDSPDLTINATGSVTINSPISLAGKSGEGETGTTTCNDCYGRDGGNLVINASNIYVNKYLHTWGGSGSRYLIESYEDCDLYGYCTTIYIWSGCNGGNGGNGGNVTLNATGELIINPEGADIDLYGGDGGLGSGGGSNGSGGTDGVLDWNGPSISVAEVAGDTNMQISGAQLLDYDRFILNGNVQYGEEFDHRGLENNTICINISGASNCKPYGSGVFKIDWVEDLYLLNVRYPPNSIPLGSISVQLSLTAANTSADLDLYILDQNTGDIIEHGVNGSSGNESISTSLSPGKYLVGVSYADDGMNQSTAYTLKFKQ